MSKKKITIGIVILATIGLFLLWPAGKQSQDAVSTASQVEYPAAWTRLGLPTVPGADLTKVNGSNFQDGVEFEFEVNRPANEVGNFYEEQFEDRDFDYYEPGESGDDHYSNEFTGGSLGITIDVRPDPANKGRSKVRVAIDHEHKRTFRTNNASLRVD